MIFALVVMPKVFRFLYEILESSLRSFRRRIRSDLAALLLAPLR